MRPLPTAATRRREREIFQLAHFIAFNPGSSSSEIQMGAEAISPSCRTSHYIYLKEALQDGWIERVGNTRGTRYHPTPQFLHHVSLNTLSDPLSKRKKVGYNEEFLAGYEPNETFYLNRQQRATLHNACGVGTFDASDARVAQEVRRFMADISHNSAAFEGVEVKYADTISFLEQNIESRHMSAVDAAILRNHYNAIRFIIENTHHPLHPADVQVSEYDARNIHSYLSDGLLKDKRKQGRLRHEHVEIRDSSYIPTDQPDIISREFSLLINKARQIKDPYEQAVFLLIHIPYLQPFDDCNKRTSRLLCNIPLLGSGILPVSWAEVNHRDYTDSLLCIYEKNSTYGLCDVFVEACARSFERFEISMKNREPSRMEISHSKQIQEAVRNRILHNDRSLPRDVDALNIAEFELIVEDTLAAIRENDMVAAPYRLRPDVVQAWLEHEKLAANDAPH